MYPLSRLRETFSNFGLSQVIRDDGKLIIQQDDNDDEDDWNPCKAAGVCMMLMATCCEDAIVPHVLPFVKDNIKSPDWKFRDAAVMAFGKY